MKEEIIYTSLSSPVGDILVAQSAKGLKSIRFTKGTKPEPPDGQWKFEKKLEGDAVRQLKEYFNGELKNFTLPLDLEATPFQLKVWRALQKIPYGETLSYGELAKWIGQPKAIRAVGGANGKNRIPIVIPCHRVIGSDGSLTGFGSGLHIKSALLEHERKYSQNS